MAKELRNTIRLGVFVIVGLILFTAAIYFVGKQENLFTPRFHISTIVKNANGVQKGNNVRYAGLVVGSVEDITITNDTTIQLHMIMDQKVKKFIKKDAIATITMDGIVGNMVVNINPGPGLAALVEYGDTIASYSRYGPSEMLNTLGNTNDNIAHLSFKLIELVENLNEGQGTLPRLISDSVMAHQLNATIYNLHLTTRHLAVLSQQLQAEVAGVSAGEGTLGYLLHDQTLPHQLEALSTRLDSLLFIQTQPIISDLQKSSADIAASSTELKAALQDLNQGGGLAQTLLRDTAAARNLQETLANLNQGTARFSENMEALKHNFLLKRYFKKQEKLEKTNQ